MSSQPTDSGGDVEVGGRYAQLVASIDGIVWEADAQTFQFTFVSQQAVRLLGYPLEDWLRPGFWVDHVHPEDRDWAGALCQVATRELRNHDFEYRMIARDGRVVWLRDIVTVVVEEETTRLRGVMVDVTARRRAEEALRQSETMYRSVVTAMAEGVVFQSASGAITAVNPAAERILGCTAEQMRGRTSDDPGWKAIHEDGSPFPGEMHPSMVTLRTGQPQSDVVMGAHRPDGALVWISINSEPLVAEGGRPHGVVATFHDITTRKKSEEDLRRAEAQYRSIFDNAVEGIFRSTPGGRFLAVNPALARMLGYSSPDELKATIQDIARELYADPARRAEYARLLEEEGVVQGFECQFVRKNGSKAWVSLSTRAVRDGEGRIASYEGTVEEITDRKRLEEQLRQSQKMEAVGRLAGGVAHDFNNLLTAINGYSELVFKSLRPDDANRGLLAEIQKAGERAAGLTRQLLAFSRKQVLQPQVVNINALLGDLGRMLERLIGEDVEFEFRPEPTAGLARVDPAQFEQAIINLVINARDAMPRGGRLSIETHNAELNEDAGAEAEVRPGGYVLVSVTDTGQGMDEATQGRIFEPFFTTKEVGKGTGLGLAMVYGFVKQSGGHIEVVSEPGSGTTIKVYLPRSEGPPPAVKLSPDQLAVPRGAETVLLVEDEVPVRALAQRVLVSAGYTVLEAQDGEEAVWVAQGHRGAIHILVTDLVMPRMSGRQLAELLVERMPHLRALFMSGYTSEALLGEGAQPGGVAFLQKPFSPAELARKVREVLDAGKERR